MSTRSSARHSPGHRRPAAIGAVVDDWPMYSDRGEDYTIGRPIGVGASATVYSATYKPVGSKYKPIQCALKVVDLDTLPPQALRLLRRETQLMSLSKHPHVLRVRGTWTEGHKLYIALRIMNSGSAADVMHYGWPDGFEEEVIKCMLKQALEGINYLHINGLIHRDIKAANLLIDEDGTVLVGDLGVAVMLSDEETATPKSISRATSQSPARTPLVASSSVGTGARPAGPVRHGGKRKSFVGTPCWMAPELILGNQYDSSADIWSFGITALELASGRAPRSRDPPHKVLLATVQDSPPTLAADGMGSPHRYSRHFREMIASCLVKDPAQRPSAAELLQMPFFRSPKPKRFLVSAVLKGLPPLVDRQERTRLLVHADNRTVASWDFTQTIQSRPKTPDLEPSSEFSESPISPTSEGLGAPRSASGSGSGTISGGAFTQRDEDFDDLLPVRPVDEPATPSECTTDVSDYFASEGSGSYLSPTTSKNSRSESDTSWPPEASSGLSGKKKSSKIWAKIKGKAIPEVNDSTLHVGRSRART